ncbi:MAG: LCP family protein [Thermomicrobiales bacterium]
MPPALHPRDSRVELPGYGLSKINHALAVGGIPYEKLVVEQFLGVKIDHYALIDFSGMETFIDKIGGVDIVITDDPFTIDGYTFKPGPIHLTGKEALAYARYRYGPDGDFGRIRRQHQVIAAAIDKLSSSSAPSMAKLVPDTLDSLAAHVRTDLSAGQLTDLGTDIIDHCSGGKAQDETIQGTVGTFQDPLLNMDLSYVIVDEADRDRKVHWLVTGEPLQGQPAATPSATPSAVLSDPVGKTQPTARPAHAIVTLSC